MRRAASRTAQAPVEREGSDGRLRSARRALPVLVAVALLSTLTVGVASAARLGSDAQRMRIAVAPSPSPSAVAPDLSTSDLALPFPNGTASPAASAAPSAAAPSRAPAVAPLKALRAPDLLVTVTSPLTPAQVSALGSVRAVTAISVVDIGTVKVGGKGARLVGVDPSSFRPFTPAQTAGSDALWQSVARGDLAPDYALARARKLPLGGSVAVDGAADVTSRVGAVAAYGLPGIDLVTDQGTARQLGVVPSSAVLLSAPQRSIGALQQAVRAVVGQDAVVDVLRPAPVPVLAPTARPTTYRGLYIDSARYCPGLSWTVLAAIGQVESDHGRNNGPSSAGALGPMQFLPSTWATYGLDGDGDGKADINDPFDAVPAAATYLCRFGANRGQQGLYDAVFAYNHADWYVREVLALAAQYR